MDSPLTFNIREIPQALTHEWLLNKHYAHRLPSISYAYGLYDKSNILQGVCTYGSPPSRALVRGLCGDKHMDIIFELNRLVVNERLGRGVLSHFVSCTLKLLPKPLIIVSYSDTAQGHNGYIYQACNFLYTGLSAKRTEWVVEGLEHLHSKTLSDGETKESLTQKYGDKLGYRERARKHRYIYVIGNKSQKRSILSEILYPVLPYPKGDNKRYDASYLPRTQGILL